MPVVLWSCRHVRWSRCRARPAAARTPRPHLSPQGPDGRLLPALLLPAGNRTGRETADRMLQLAAAAGYNMMRMWVGSTEPADKIPFIVSPATVAVQ